MSESELQSTKVNLLDYDRAAFAELMKSMGEKPFRAQQLLKWIHDQQVLDFSLMSNLSKAFREKLEKIAEIRLPEVILDKVSTDGTRKWLLRLDDGNAIETVYIPEAARGTLCVSSQVGCALNCSFCSTAQEGFSRNLTTGEIIGQVWLAKKLLTSDEEQRKVTNVVMMGMGEPLLNFDSVVSAMDLMMDDLTYCLAKRRVTLSTSGVVPEMQKLSEVSDVALAVSLHAADDELRNVLVPINKKYPIKQLMSVCRNYFANEPRRKVTFEYVMLAGVNDSLAQAKQLAKILQGVPSKVNLIPFNPFPGTIYTRSSEEVIHRFAKVLQDSGLTTITRRTRGDDIDAACGQLVGQVKDRTKRQQRARKRLQQIPVDIVSQ